MGERKRFLALLIFFQFYQDLYGAITIKVEPEKVVANPGESVTFICRRVSSDGVELTPDSLESCIFKMGEEDYLGNDTAANLAVYKGEGQDINTCIITINKIRDQGYGDTSCSMKTKGSGKADKGPMILQVSSTPKSPKLYVTSNGKNVSEFKEKDTLTATCTVEDGWPAAVISWYLDTQLMDGLPKPNETCKNVNNNKVCTVQQSFTRTLQSSDDKKVLKCSAKHQSYMGGEKSAEFQINVNYGPKAANQKFEFFGLTEGTTGRVNILVNANPRPDILWSIDDEVIYEGHMNGRFKVEQTIKKENGAYESTLVIDPLNKEDTIRNLKVVVRNDAGTKEYPVYISTSPEPEAFGISTDQIIIIGVAILLILLVLGGIFYTRAKGMLCFSDSRRVTGESSDTESADHTSHQSSKLKLLSIFKKKGDKMEGDKEVLKEGQPVGTNDKVDNVVYAELDLAPRPVVHVRLEDNKTEYAEIIHTQPPPK